MSAARAGGGGLQPAPEAAACRVGVAVPAAGSGTRMAGGDLDAHGRPDGDRPRKVFLALAGEPVLLHALRPFLADGRVTALAVALAPEDAEDPPPWIGALDARIRVVAGGETRTASVRAALEALPEDLDVIAVHDGARPLVPPEAVRAALDLAAGGAGAVVGCPAVDTLKRVDAEARVAETPDRATLWHAHTPQAFPAALLREAYADPSAAGTDDAALVERLGAPVRMVDGGRFNLKITHPGDLAVAEALLGLRPPVAAP